MLYEERITNRISPGAEQGRRLGGQPLVDATGVVARSQIASATDQATEPVSRQERAQFHQQVREIEEAAVFDWLRTNELFVSEEDFLQQWSERKIGEGAEQQVYLNNDGRSVLKTNDAIMHGTWLEFFDRIALHNWLFPEVHYKLIGFTTVKAKLAALIKQPFVRSNRGASREEVDKDLHKRGFARIRNDDYHNPELGIVVEDLHDENVLTDEAGSLFYFDPVIYLQTLDMKLPGSVFHRFPFEDRR